MQYSSNVSISTTPASHSLPMGLNDSCFVNNAFYVFPQTQVTPTLPSTKIINKTLTTPPHPPPPLPITHRVITVVLILYFLKTKKYNDLSNLIGPNQFEVILAFDMVSFRGFLFILQFVIWLIKKLLKSHTTQFVLSTTPRVNCQQLSNISSKHAAVCTLYFQKVFGYLMDQQIIDSVMKLFHRKW